MKISTKTEAYIALQNNTLYYKNFSESLKNNHKVTIAALLSYNGYLIWDEIPEKLFDDKDFINEVLSFKYNSLLNVFYKASDKIKDDEELVCKAFEISPKITKVISDRLKDDEEFMLKLIQHDKKYTKNDYYKSCLESENYYINNALKYSSDRLKNKEDFILKALKINPLSINYASEELLNKEDFILKALKINPYYVSDYVSEDLLKKEDFLLKAIELNPLFVKYCPEELRKDRKFMLKNIKKNYESALYLDEKLLNDKDFMFEACKLNRGVCVCFPPSLKSDTEFMLKIIKIAPFAFNFVLNETNNNSIPKETINNFDFIAKAIGENKSILKSFINYVYEDPRNDVIENADEEFLSHCEAIINDPRAFAKLPTKYLNSSYERDIFIDLTKKRFELMENSNKKLQGELKKEVYDIIEKTTLDKDKEYRKTLKTEIEKEIFSKKNEEKLLNNINEMKKFQQQCKCKRFFNKDKNMSDENLLDDEYSFFEDFEL